MRAARSASRAWRLMLVGGAMAALSLLELGAGLLWPSIRTLAGGALGSLTASACLAAAGLLWLLRTRWTARRGGS